MLLTEQKFQDSLHVRPLFVDGRDPQINNDALQQPRSMGQVGRTFWNSKVIRWVKALVINSKALAQSNAPEKDTFSELWAFKQDNGINVYKEIRNLN